MPQYLAMGVSEERFRDYNPKKLEPYVKAYKLQCKHEDEAQWRLGMYILNATSVAIEHNLAGKKAKSEYRKEPILFDLFDERTQEEKDADELRKMIAAEEAWIIVEKQNGLKAATDITREDS